MKSFQSLVIIILNLLFEIVLSANPNYSYHVNILDPNEANYQQKGETRLGEKTEGFYSVLEPDGGLRTVTYVSDEHGFRPTVTYSYAHSLQPIIKKKVISPTILKATPVIKENNALFLNGGYNTFSGTPLQYASSYATPVFTVKDTRHFYKTPQIQPVQIFKALPPPPPVVSATVFKQPVVVKAVATTGYSYPVPEKKLEYPTEPPPKPEIVYPPPSPPKATYLPPPPTTTTTPAPPIVTKKPASGYLYPVPEVKLEYPKEEPIAPTPTLVIVEQPVVQAVPPSEEPQPVPLDPVPIPQPIYPPPPKVITAVQPAAQVFQYINFGAKLQPKVPLQQIVYQRPLIQPQPQYQQVIYKQPVKVAYTHNPAQVYHKQIHHAIQPQTVVHAVAPVQQPVYQQFEVAPAPQPLYQQFTVAPRPVVQAIPPQPQPIYQQVSVAPQPLIVQNYEDIVNENVGMRYGTVPISTYLPPTPKPFLPQSTPVVQAIPPPQVKLISKGVKNPLTFNYGYDNGVSKVTHSYYGSGW